MYEFTELEKIALVAAKVPERKKESSNLNTSLINAYSPDDFLEKQADTIRNTPEGSRNQQANVSAFQVGAVVKEGLLDGQFAGKALVEAAVDSGLDEDEATSVVTSGLEAGTEKANLPPGASGWWEEPILPETQKTHQFPVESLPQPLRGFVKSLAESTQTPHDLTAILSLGMVATVCAPLVKVQANDDWFEQVNIYVVVVQRPGTRKSAVLSNVASPIYKYESEEKIRLGPETAAAISKKNILEAKLKQLEAQAMKKDDLDDEIRELTDEINAFKIPRAIRYLADDSSPEKIPVLMSENNGCIAIVSAEGGGVFDNAAGRYSKSGGSNLGIYNKGYDGDHVNVDRVSRASDHIPEPTLTMILTIQPEILEGLIKKSGFLGTGFLARFIYVLPEDLLGKRIIDPPTMPTGIKQAYHDLISELLSFSMNKDQNGFLVRRSLKLDSVAYKLLCELQEKIEPHLAKDGSLANMTDWAGKCAGKVVRIAGLLHMVEHSSDPNPWDYPISAKTMADAITIGRYCLSHARAAYQEFSLNQDDRDMGEVLQWIQRKKLLEFSARKVFQRFKTRFNNMERANKILKNLIDRHCIRLNEGILPKGPGRPSTVYDVNPAILRKA